MPRYIIRQPAFWEAGITADTPREALRQFYERCGPSDKEVGLCSWYVYDDFLSLSIRIAEYYGLDSFNVYASCSNPRHSAPAPPGCMTLVFEEGKENEAPLEVVNTKGLPDDESPLYNS